MTNIFDNVEGMSINGKSVENLSLSGGGEIVNFEENNDDIRLIYNLADNNLYINLTTKKIYYQGNLHCRVVNRTTYTSPFDIIDIDSAKDISRTGNTVYIDGSLFCDLTQNENLIVEFCNWENWSDSYLNLDMASEFLNVCAEL